MFRFLKSLCIILGLSPSKKDKRIRRKFQNKIPNEMRLKQGSLTISAKHRKLAREIVERHNRDRFSNTKSSTPCSSSPKFLRDFHSSDSILVTSDYSSSSDSCNSSSSSSSCNSSD